MIHLKGDWMKLLDEKLIKPLSAFACLKIMRKIGDNAPFEKVELACLLYKKIMHKVSFQLVINSLVDKSDRENLLHRLTVNEKLTDHQFRVDCIPLVSVFDENG
jgi:hypothetical protein